MMKRITKVLLPLLMLGFVLFSAGCDSGILELPREVDNPPKEAELPEEEKIYWEGTIEEDFDGSSVLVVMDKYTGGINKKHEDSYFGDFEKVYVKDLTAITKDIKDALIDVEKFRQILMIKLPIDSKENVVRVIRELEKIKGILAACPNHYYYPSVP